MISELEQSTDKPLILVVDDETGPRESLKIILTPSYRVVTAQDGDSALARIEEEPPDLVISDVRMPGMSGTRLLREVKARSPETPVILITGYANVQSAQEAVRGGAFDYINKPYDVEEIQQIVSRALVEAKARRSSQRLLQQLQTWNRQLQEQIGQLDQKATVADLSAELIHDLNNPMTVLQGYISLLEDSVGSNGKDASASQMEEFMSIVKAQVERCVTLTRNFLDFARHPNNSWEECNINNLIQDTLFVLRVRMMKQSIESRVRPDADLPDCWLMPTAMQQVLYNLVSNAIDALAESRKKGIIRIETGMVEEKSVAGSETEHLKITISDNGPGIPSEIMERIFTPFFTTKGKSNGTGLGLSICQRIVTVHQGQLRVNSICGKGTSFEILIPLFQEIPRQAEEAVETANIS